MGLPSKGYFRDLLLLKTLSLVNDINRGGTCYLFVELGKDLVSNLSILFDTGLDIPLSRVVTLMTHVIFNY